MNFLPGLKQREIMKTMQALTCIKIVTDSYCKQATVLLYGHGHSGTDVSVLSSIFFKEPVLVSTVGASGGFENDGRPSAYTRALRLIEQKQIDIAPLITHRYSSFADVDRALSSDIHGEDYVKGVVVLAADKR